MIKHNFLSYLFYFLLSLCVVLFSEYIGSVFLRTFFSQSLVVLLVALFAIGTAARTALLGKLKELGDNHSVQFTQTVLAMKQALFEQLFMILIAFIFSILVGSVRITSLYWAYVLIMAILGVGFLSSLQIIYDTTNAIMIILEEQHKTD